MNEYSPGQRVRITQQILFGQRTLTTTVEGVILRCGQQKTGSWFAHSKDNKVWMDRIELEKDDGERVICNLDQYTAIEILDGAPNNA